MKTWKRRHNILIFIFLLLVLGVILLFVEDNNINKKRDQQKATEEKVVSIQNTFANVDVLAKTFSVYDETDKKEIYTRNGNAILPLASLTKIMTVIIALEKNNLNDFVTVSAASSGENPNSDTLLGEKWRVEDLAKFTLISSSNDGAVALAMNDPNFLSDMNKKAGMIGMQSTTFSDFTGLDLGGGIAGSFGTSKDVTLMALYAIENYPDVFHATVYPSTAFLSESGITHNVVNTNTITDKIPNLIFSKTGWTTLAGGNLCIIFKNKMGHVIAITLLGSTEEGRFTDMEKLIGIAYNL